MVVELYKEVLEVLEDITENVSGLQEKKKKSEMAGIVANM